MQNTIRIACLINVRVLSFSPAPTLLAIMEVNPTPKAITTPLTSIFGDWLMDTDAVAAAPIEPTIAVSTACTSEVRTCSRKIGQESIRIVIHGFLLSSTMESLSRFLSPMRSPRLSL